MESRRQKRIGVAYGLSAYLWWGFIALYFKAVGHVPALEIVAHRIVWSLLLLLGRIVAKRRVGEYLSLFRDKRTFLTMQGTTLLIATNWLIFIWAVANGRVLEASLGYFINPLVNVLLGYVFLGERLRGLQGFAVVLASAGVLWLSISYGQPPFVALFLAFTFGFYGLLRKIARPDGVLGLAAETTLLAPLAIGYLAWHAFFGEMVFLHLDRRTDWLLVASGLVTALPLVWFAEAARRLRYATVGFLQYIAPSLQFLLAVIVFHEDFTRDHLIAFSLIWCALVVFSWDTVRTLRARKTDETSGLRETVAR